MLFNSSVFAIFFSAFLLLYWLLRNSLRGRNLLIVVGSYFFYGWWSWKLLSLLLISSLVDYGVGLALDGTTAPKRRKLLLLASVGTNLSILGFFKYFGFFVESFTDLLALLGWQMETWSLSIVLPMGISFYTFQTMSYTLDIYRGQMKPTRSLVDFMAYVAFFPQLVAGPIERARHLLPQFERKLKVTFPMMEEGISLCIWGMFKKVVLADNLDPLVNMVYDNPAPGMVMVVLATVAFGVQIYCDFSGYTDIARGVAKMLGFDLMLNFKRPYAATSIKDFWRRWHISLSSWLRDYLYISLGGNRRGPVRTYVNLVLTMLLGGLWHGAAWNFILWGGWHGGGLALHRLFTERFKRRSNQPATAARRILGWAVTMMFVLYGWLLFRATSMDQIANLTAGLLRPALPSYWPSYVANLLAYSLPLVAVEVWQAWSEKQPAPVRISWAARSLTQGAMVLAVLLFWEKVQSPFIYFQF